MPIFVKGARVRLPDLAQRTGVIHQVFGEQVPCAFVRLDAALLASGLPDPLGGTLITRVVADLEAMPEGAP